MLREAYLMKKCEHEGVLQCLHIYETKKTFELVFEFANVGEWLNTVRFAPACKGKSYRMLSRALRADDTALF